jgi:hypothetical protein
MADSRHAEFSTPDTQEVSLDEEVMFHPRYTQNAETTDSESRDAVHMVATPVLSSSTGHARAGVKVRDCPERSGFSFIDANRLLTTPAAGDGIALQGPTHTSGASVVYPGNYGLEGSTLQPNGTGPLQDRMDRMLTSDRVPVRSQSSTGGKPSYRPDRFDGSTPWREYIAHFESCSKINGWDDVTKCNYLAVGLRGQAQQILSDLGGVTHTNYANLVKLLEGRYGPGDRAEVHLAELRNRQRKTDESLQELGQSMRRLTGMAYPEINRENQDRLARIHFVDAIQDKEIRMNLFQARPASLDEAIRVALEVESYLESEKLRQGSRAKVGHTRALELQPPTMEQPTKSEVKTLQLEVDN